MSAIVTTAQSLQILLAGAITTNQLEFTIVYENEFKSGETSTANNHGLTNSGTAVTFLAAPTSAGEKRTLQRANVFNADTVNATVTVRLNDNGTLRRLVVVTLSTLETLVYETSNGWYVLTALGATK